MQIKQSDLYEQLRTEALANRQRLISIARPLDPERLVRRPTPPGWSVGEVLEHLCVSDEIYERPVTRLIAGARRDAGAPFREWRPSFIGNLLASMLGKPGKMRAPKRFRPGATPRNGVLEDFLARDTRMMQRMEDAATLDWRALRLSPPSLPPIFRINLGDVFRIYVVHVRRHLKQIERVIAQQT